MEWICPGSVALLVSGVCSFSCDFPDAHSENVSRSDSCGWSVVNAGKSFCLEIIIIMDSGASCGFRVAPGRTTAVSTTFYTSDISISSMTPPLTPAWGPGSGIHLRLPEINPQPNPVHHGMSSGIPQFLVYVPTPHPTYNLRRTFPLFSSWTPTHLRDSRQSLTPGGRINVHIISPSLPLIGRVIHNNISGSPTPLSG